MGRKKLESDILTVLQGKPDGLLLRALADGVDKEIGTVKACVFDMESRGILTIRDTRTDYVITVKVKQ